jgi:predicted transcriptional regulator of viral defense system
MKLNEFFSQRALFTTAELDEFLSAKGTGNLHTRKSLLAYYRKQRKIIPVRRGLYATVPPGSTPEQAPVDPYLVAAKLTPDAVLAYHTALEFHGKAYSVYERFYYLSATKSLPLRFQSREFKRAPIPPSLRAKNQEMFGIIRHQRSGVEIRVTGLERTLVDVLDRPELTGSWEEIWRSLETVEYFDLDQVLAYALLLDNATTTAKVGFFLEQHKNQLMVDESCLQRLRGLRPRQPHYLERGSRRDCYWAKEWNLMIPRAILNRTWGEVL